MTTAVAGNSSLIDKYVAEGKSIWIINRTKSLLIIDFRDSLGIGQPFRVPPEQEPMCLSNYFPPGMIKENPHLRRLISHGNIELCNPDQMEGKVSVKQAESLASMRTEKKDEEQNKHPESLVPEEDLIQATPKIAMLCEYVKTGEMKSKDFIDRIKGDKDELTEANLTFIINEMKADEKIIGWATNTLAEIKEANGSQDDTADARAIVQKGMKTQMNQQGDLTRPRTEKDDKVQLRRTT